MQQSPSWEANRFSASQEIPNILWIPKVHYRIYKYPLPVPTLSLKKYANIKYHKKNCPMGEELFHADGLAHKHDKTNSRFSEFFERA
jgi:hypothetical protein